MEKAARVVRRSSVKLLSLGGGHTDLHILLSEVKDMRNTAKAFMNAQNVVSQDLLKWSANGENRALQDVAYQLAELNLLWTDVQRDFGEHLKDYRHMFEMILEGEKHVMQSRNNFTTCEQKEIKSRKELKRAFKKSSTSEIQNLEGKLMQAERAKHLAQLEVTDRIRENEAVKLIRLKEGLLCLSKAYSDFARKCAVVFDAQQDIVQQLPDVLDQDLEDIKYTGSGVTRHRVQQAREKVRSYRPRGNNSNARLKYEELPPPYTLTDENLMQSQKTSIMPSSKTSSPRRRTSTAVEHLPAQPPAPHQSYLGSQPNPPPAPPMSQDPSTAATAVATSSSVSRQNLPPAPLEVIVPELPADLRTVTQKQALQEEEDDDPFHEDGVLQLTPADINQLLNLVDFDPNWDNSYEEDLSGAMGGAKI